MEARNYTPPPQVTSQHEFKLDTNIHYDREKIVALPNSRLAVSVDKSYQYDICLMADDIKLERDKVYIRKKGKQVTYSVMAPNGQLVFDQVLYSDVPDSFSIDKIDKAGILNITAKNGHTRSPMVEIWNFADNQKRVVAELKMDSYVHCLNASPSGQLYVGHDSNVSVWDVEQKKCIDTIDVRALMRKRLSTAKDQEAVCKKGQEVEDLIREHLNTRLTITPEGYLFSTGYNTLVTVNLKEKSCYSVMTTESCQAGNIDFPPCYAVTKSDSNRVAVIWDKATKKAVHGFSCDPSNRFMTIYFHIMPDGKMMYENRGAESFQIIGLHESKLPFLSGDYYHSVDAKYPMHFMADFLLAFPDNKHFLYRSFPKSYKEGNYNVKTWIFDMGAGESVHEAAMPNHGVSVMLTDGRVVHLDRCSSGLITQYHAIEKHMHPLGNATAFRPRC